MSDSPKRSYSWIFKLALALLGVVALVLLIQESGPENVAHTMLAAAPWLPLIFALELCFASADVFALRSFYRKDAEGIPRRDWLRSAALAYGIMVLLPAGRAGGEVARAHALGKKVGGARAAAHAAHLQVATLLANTIITLPCIAFAWFVAGSSASLISLLAVNGAATLLLAGGLTLVAKRSKIGTWLANKVSIFREHGATLDRHLREPVNYLRPIAFTTLGRVAQALQYGIILAAVGGHLTWSSTFIAQGIHLVGAGLGDFVPNQVGVTEGVYRAFASELGFGDSTARAVSIALVARLVQFALAAFCLGAYQLTGKRGEEKIGSEIIAS